MGSIVLFIIIVFLLIIFIVSLSSRLFISCSYKGTNENHQLLVKICLFKICLIKKEYQWGGANSLNLSHIVEEMENIIQKKQPWHDVKSFKKDIHKMLRISQLLLHTIHFHQFRWETMVGTKDASLTGALTGWIWAFKNITLTFLFRTSHLNCLPSIFVTPNFQTKMFRSSIDCMVSIRLGQAIYVGWQMIRKM